VTARRCPPHALTPRACRPAGWPTPRGSLDRPRGGIYYRRARAGGGRRPADAGGARGVAPPALPVPAPPGAGAARRVGCGADVATCTNGRAPLFAAATDAATAAAATAAAAASRGHRLGPHKGLPRRRHTGSRANMPLLPPRWPCRRMSRRRHATRQRCNSLSSASAVPAAAFGANTPPLGPFADDTCPPGLLHRCDSQPPLAAATPASRHPQPVNTESRHREPPPFSHPDRCPVRCRRPSGSPTGRPSGFPPCERSPPFASGPIRPP